MAAALVGPLLEALEAINDELNERNGEGVRHE
jgi:hypothetical protein